MAKDIIYNGVQHILTAASASYYNHCTGCSLKYVCDSIDSVRIEDEIECDENSNYFAN